MNAIHYARGLNLKIAPDAFKQATIIHSSLILAELEGHLEKTPLRQQEYFKQAQALATHLEPHLDLSPLIEEWFGPGRV
jgi:hypothetical protein